MRSRSRRQVRRVPQGRERYRRRRGPFQKVVSAFRGLITTAVLVGAGALIGLFWEEGQVVRLVAPAADPAVEPAAVDPTTPPPPESLSTQLNFSNRIKVEVLNGVGEAGLARRFANRLRELGFDVVATDNADHFEHGVTHVLDRSGRLGAAVEVADGLQTDSVTVELNPDLYLDVTVVVGSDWPEAFGRR
ncbi:LytR C-terminal domain-containing protein [Candidatus Palauibacter sp.]|uniref:LytR C-terminal domain-containing protein n=1 Tax=Candidatus Palauibacter sp. TaxID=3101350 RepID=UPI003AF2B887